MNVHRFWVLLLAVTGSLGLLAATAAAGTIAYQVPAGTVGNQAFGGPLGMDFDVQRTIRVTHLGVFDDGSNGLSRNLTAYLYNRAASSLPVVSLGFTGADPGTLIGGSRFKPLATPLYLPWGFQGSIVGENYGTGEQNGNSATPTWTTDGGGGLLAFVGTSRFGTTLGVYPPTADGGPANKYAAGTFIFEQPNIAYDVRLGTVGGQLLTGALGMDFRTNRPLKITHLGVFDSSGDGISGTLNAVLYARTKNNSAGVAVATLAFSGTAGELIGGTRFLELASPLLLPGGFDGSIVMELNGANLNGNSPTPTDWATYDGGGALSFVGGGRYTLTASAYPGTVDGGPANRYAAGSFIFAEADPRGPGVTTTIPVNNFSFETPAHGPGGFSNSVPGWVPSAGNNAGNFRPTAAQFPAGVTDGLQVAFVNGGALTSAPLGETLQADTLYILDVDWGHRLDSPNPQHSMNLRAGGIDLGWVNNGNIFNGPTPPPGQFRTARGYFTANHNAPLGGALDVNFTKGGTGQAIYDNVRLQKITGAAILLNNPSFELDDMAAGGGSQVGAAGWVAGGNAGVFEGATEITPAAGLQSAYAVGGATLTQTLLGVPLENDHRYLLLVDVADRLATPFVGYRVELLAGGQTIAIDDNSLGVIQASGGPGFFFTTSVIDYRSMSANALAGQDLGIRLTALGGATNQTYFDNVRLFAVAVPEPSSVALGLAGLAALLGLAWRRRRK